MNLFAEWLFGRHPLRDLSDVLSKALRKAKEKEPHCCEVPELPCPPRCVGLLQWCVGRGADAQASIVLHNRGRVSRQFAFSTSALAGLDAAGASLLVEPATLPLAPGESGVVTLKLLDTQSLSAGQQYHAELLFEGSWKQCVKLEATLLRDASDSCSLEQAPGGETLAFLKAHRAKLNWSIQRGMEAEAQLVLRNLGEGGHTFHIESTPWVGIDADAAALELSTDALHLSGGERGVVQLRLKNSQSFRPCQTYHCEIVVRGYQEQRVQLSCKVERDPSAHLEIEQGEAPQRVRAHHWYDHFQCTEPCEEGHA